MLAAVGASGLPVLNPERYRRTADVLNPEAVSAYIESIAGRGAILLVQLRQADAALHFERAVKNEAADASSLADTLGAAIEVTLQQLHLRSTALEVLGHPVC